VTLWFPAFSWANVLTPLLSKTPKGGKCCLKLRRFGASKLKNKENLWPRSQIKYPVPYAFFCLNCSYGPVYMDILFKVKNRYLSVVYIPTPQKETEKYRRAGKHYWEWTIFLNQNVILMDEFKESLDKWSKSGAIKSASVNGFGVIITLNIFRKKKWFIGEELLIFSEMLWFFLNLFNTFYIFKIIFVNQFHM
jgi:hypothetical protein